jgi:succinyl-CoA synthetase beta subunit
MCSDVSSGNSHTSTPILARLENELKALLAERGVPVPRGIAGPTAIECQREAIRLTYPVAVKALSLDLPHKQRVGAVRTWLRSPTAVGEAIVEVERSVASLAPGARIAGFLVEEMVPAGLELIIGVLRDPTFGLVGTVGIGGTLTEQFGQAAFRLAPVTRKEIRAMLGSLPIRLLGAKGLLRTASEGNALIEMLLAVMGRGGLYESFGDRLSAVEINPLIITSNGAVAVDVKLMELR